ncbi:helix-turn-helix transcriptional regulator [Streptomyces sp. NPDC005708]|uniref:helix-turn-helix transcriptional regulator n=1 Tax=Streptomyces sp. NPDC005708 TaxID=3154564 RepID=UPI0033FED606
MGGTRNTKLGDFLRARRAALSPGDAGIATHGSPRRVPGLRRDEVARLAGVSVNYYARIEQGEDHHLSGSVMEAIAGALRLNDIERLHLLRLAWPAQVVRHRAGPEEVRDSVIALAESTTQQAVYIVGRRTDLLGGNRLGFALLGLSPDLPSNLARHIFLEPAMRDLIVDWNYWARHVAGYLQMTSVEYPDDPLMTELISELRLKSREFEEFWDTQPVAECTHAVREFNHPLVGHLTLREEIVRLSRPPDQHIIFNGAAPGSESAERLRLLDSLASSNPAATTLAKAPDTRATTH